MLYDFKFTDNRSIGMKELGFIGGSVLILKTLFIKFVDEPTRVIWILIIMANIPGMLLAEFVVVYKPCKSKPRCENGHPKIL